MTTLGSGHDEFDRSIKKIKIETQIQQTHIAILPEHLIFDHILSRLPVKSLTRFKLVSKFWLSIISSFAFAQTHLKFSSLCPQFVVLSKDPSLKDHFKLFLLPYDESNNVRDLVRLDLDNNWVLTNLDVVGSCNGLLCLYLEGETKYGHFCLWNPVTKECREIKNPNDETCVYSVEYVFGYAASDYKIVALFSPHCYCYVFSLRTNKWEIIDGLDGCYVALALDDRAVVFDDTLYWPLAYPKDCQNNLKDWQKARCIVGFDLVNVKFKEIPLMDWLVQYNGADFFGMEDRLSLHCHGDQGSDVWVQKQYDDWNSWEKLFSVKLGNRLSFLEFTETGKCLVQSSDQLKVIDPRKDSTEESQMGAPFSGQISKTCAYVESFISPFDPFSKSVEEIRIE